MASTATSPVAGDVVTVNFALRPTDPDRVFEEGTVSFVLGRGGYLPSLHETVASMKEGESQTALAVDAGFGEYMDAAKATLPIAQAPAGLKEGVSVMIQTSQGQQRAVVTEMTEDTFTLDANHPKAGTKLELDVELLSVDAGAVKHEVATFAGGCFWGTELQYMRMRGVVATCVGYTQGTLEQPTYSEVCSGTTGHTEACQIVYDPKRCPYELLCAKLFETIDPTVLNRVGNDVGTQYRHGIYPHTTEQLASARAVVAREQKSRTKPIVTEVKEAAIFWPAEEYHQQYLKKGGQSASKGETERVRCYG